ncbi:MAG TPA: ABC transporter ATP-binding protein [Solirubrobacteraceae bacterium]|jgi:spermidine/putrescine transport system ATP-binding protein|nr:ABC transporter ATP-binding protein [Solirubrobacteraceae bacterium]
MSEPTTSAVTAEPAASETPPSVPAVRLLGLGRRYGEVLAVDEIDVEIGDGEFFSMIGPSGCGKTTTLRMIAGLVEPTAGRVEVHGRDVTALRPHRRPVNTVFQQYALFPHLDVFENVAFGLRERRTPSGEITTRVKEMLELVDLSGRERNRPSQLSGGQQQRVALARSLILGPEVLLLDEPLGALDLKLRKQLQLQLKRIQREVGITFVYVTHDQEEAFFMSDRVAIMRDGRMEQVGSPRDVYERPATEFVAEFVGASNRIPATIVDAETDGAYRVELEGLGQMRVAGVPGLRPGQRASAIVRPEAITTGPVPAGHVAVSARIVDLAYLGHQISCLAESQAGAQIAISVHEARAPVAVGETYELSWPVSAMWLVARDDTAAQAAT